MNSSLLFTPTLSALLKNRPACLAVSGATMLHLTLMSLGLPSWQCPLRYGLNIPCPGCGLSRSVAALAHGHWHDAVNIHAFFPLMMAAILLILVASFLTDTARLSLANRLENVEVDFGITNFILVAFVIYWLVRLLFFSSILYRLVM